MLLTIPTELQSHIIAFLPRRDMVAVGRTCRYLNAVANMILYRRVELHSLAQAEAFFIPSTILRKGSPAEIKHAESKRAQWEAIRVLVLSTARDDRSRSLGTLPKSLRGGRVKPIDLDGLHVESDDDGRALLPLLQCFNPRSIRWRAAGFRTSGLECSLAATGWRDVTHFTLVGESGRLLTFQPPVLTSSFVRVSKVRSATLVDRYSSPSTPMEPAFRFDVARLVRLYPGLDGLKIVTRTTSTFRPKIEEMIRGGIAGKPASFFSVELETKS